MREFKAKEQTINIGHFIPLSVILNIYKVENFRNVHLLIGTTSITLNTSYVF